MACGNGPGETKPICAGIGSQGSAPRPPAPEPWGSCTNEPNVPASDRCGWDTPRGTGTPCGVTTNGASAPNEANFDKTTWSSKCRVGKVLREVGHGEARKETKPICPTGRRDRKPGNRGTVAPNKANCLSGCRPGSRCECRRTRTAHPRDWSTPPRSGKCPRQTN